MTWWNLYRQPRWSNSVSRDLFTCRLKVMRMMMKPLKVEVGVDLRDLEEPVHHDVEDRDEAQADVAEVPERRREEE